MGSTRTLSYRANGTLLHSSDSSVVPEPAAAGQHRIGHHHDQRHPKVVEIHADFPRHADAKADAGCGHLERNVTNRVVCHEFLKFLVP